MKGSFATAMGLTLLALAASPTAVASASVAPPPVKRFALVVGSNRPPRAGMAKLRYADDDAVRWAALFRTFGAEVELLTDLDTESERLYGSDAPPHRSATHSELIGAMGRLRAAIERARAAGAHATFYFVYAGHGDEEDGEGFVGLADGRLFRRDIEREILAVSGADTNHVVVDACRSYYMAYDRGPGGTRRPWPEPYFSTGAAARFANTGFVLASSSGGPSHEWEEFQAGIFSHEVRSGLLGGADANGDGRITYAELAAFVRVANQAVRNERYRPEILARAPSNGDDVLLDLREAVAGRVHFGAGLAGRQVLEDGLGVRWADVHPGPRQSLTLALPAVRWAGDEMFVESMTDSSEYRLKAGEDVDLATVEAQPRSVLMRGALHEAFALLFAVPFDDSALMASRDPEAVVASALNADPPTSGPAWTPKLRRRARLLTATGSGLAFAAAGGLAWSAAALRADAQNATGAQRAALDAEIGSRNQWTTVTLASGVLLAAAVLVLFVWDR